MSEYVSKEELKEFFESIEITVAGRTRAEAIGEVLQAIYIGVMELPTTDAEPVRHGKWIETEENHGFNNEVRNKALACSVCRVAFRISDYAQIEDFRYCPNCGARMDKE